MDKPEAQQLLQAVRPDSHDAAQPLFAEALALVERDPQLQAWWEAEQDFDRRVTAKLAEIPVPTELRASLLTGQKIVPFPAQPRFSYWLAAAAAVAILCAVSSSFRAAWEDSLHMPNAHFDAAAVALLGNDAPNLGMTSADHDQVVAWLKQQNAPTGSMPSKMSGLPSVGCQKYVVSGHNVSLICFTMADGRLVHLFVIDQKALSDPPSLNNPDFKQVQGWSTASWSDGRMSYLLATRDDPATLKQLL